jgi:peptidoglycan/LPS O-acetylase OafA/YrhL
VSGAAATSARLPHRRSIDGLRALAVSAVLLYHADVAWLPGGFLGVDVFFAISGYLITSLLLAEHAGSASISLRTFWARRARRLLPALGVLLLGVVLLAMIDAHDSVARLRGDVLAALTYSSNWWQVIRGETYFETFGRPPLLRHLWSLAVEEQLYIALPLAFALLSRRGWLRHRRRIAFVALVGAIASLRLLDVVWRTEDPSRAWYGTDTRAAGLLVGVAFALLWPMAERRRWTGAARACLDGLSAVSIGLLALLMMHVGERDAALHEWGFGAAALLSGVAVVTVTSPSMRLGRILHLRPLQWVGTRSYAIYLWHWPVFALTRPRLDVSIAGWQLLAVRLLLTAVAAELSWRLVERPFRTGAVRRSWLELRRGVRIRIAVVATGSFAVLAAALGVGMSAASTVTPELLATVSFSPTTATTLVTIPSTTTSSSTTTPSTTSTTAAPVTTAPRPAPTTTVAPAPPPPPAGAVLAVGDSVMLAARDALVQAGGGRMYVDAAVGRQVEAGLMVLQHYKDQGTLQQVSALVVHLGTNGPMSDDLFNQLATIVEGVPRVVVLNVRVPKRWEGESNAAINGGTTRFPAMRLGDWYTASNQPGAVGDDGVHPSRSGARLYSELVLRGLEGAPPSTTTTAPPPSSTTTTSTTVPPATAPASSSSSTTTRLLVPAP